MMNIFEPMAIKTIEGKGISTEKGLPLLGCSLEMTKDPLKFIKKVHSRGEGIIDLNIPFLNIAMVSDADLINEILNDRTDSFRKSDRDVSMLSVLLGDGLVTSNGELHKKKKKSTIPAFKFQWLERYLETANNEVNLYVSRIKTGEYRNIAKDMVDITFMINMKILFGDDVSEIEGGLGEISDIINELSAILLKRMTSGFVLPSWVPSNENRRIISLQKRLGETVDKLINDKLKDQSFVDNKDMMSIMINELNKQNIPIEVDTLRDELMTLFVAGYETTAGTMTWVYYHLAADKNIMRQVQAELESIKSASNLTFEECQRLNYCDMMLKETMRLRPAIWALVDRQANNDIRIGDYVIPKNKTLFLSTYGVQKNPKYFKDPDLFDPERFNEMNKSKIVKGSYFPFGMGHRICIGAGLSTVIMKSILAGVFKKYDIEIDPKQIIKEEATLSLKSEYGLNIRYLDRN